MDRHHVLLPLHDTELLVVLDALYSLERDRAVALDVADRVRALIGLNLRGEQVLRSLGLGRARGRPQG
jgi:hypothetical protein